MTHDPEQQIRECLQSGDYRLTQVPEIHTLLARIDELTAERDEALANVGELNQLLSDTLSRTKIAEQQVNRLAAALAAERADVVRWLRERSDVALRDSKKTIIEHTGDALRAQARSLRSAADAISRNEHNQDAAARQE